MYAKSLGKQYRSLPESPSSVILDISLIFVLFLVFLALVYHLVYDIFGTNLHSLLTGGISRTFFVSVCLGIILRTVYTSRFPPSML